MLSIIFASDSKNGIGYNQGLPWNYPEDLEYFKKTTMGKPVIYGYNTFKGFKKALPGRLNIVIDRNYKPEKSDKQDNKLDNKQDNKLDNKQDIIFINKFEDIFNLKIDNLNNVFVIGGAKLIKHVIDNHFDKISKVYYTFINQEYKCDTFIDTSFLTRFSWTSSMVSETCKEVVYNVYDKVDKTDENNYINLVKNVLENGETRKNRTEVDTISLFGEQISFDLSKGFPLLTTRQVFWRGVVEELLWMLRGETDAKKLQEKKVKIWDDNTSKEFIKKVGLNLPEGHIGKGYGHQWRNYGGTHKEFCDTYILNGCSKSINDSILQGDRVSSFNVTTNTQTNYTESKQTGIDQIKQVLELLIKDPNSRRIIINAWNPKDVNLTVLPPCHCMCQFYVRKGKYLDAKLTQRSCDLFLGAPFNIASYSLLIHIFCKITGYTPGKLVYSLGDCHIYSIHKSECQELISRPVRKLPSMSVTREFKGKTTDELIKEIESLEFSDFNLTGYNPHSVIKAKMVA